MQDKDGTIPCQEVGTAMRALGLFPSVRKCIFKKRKKWKYVQPLPSLFLWKLISFWQASGIIHYKQFYTTTRRRHCTVILMVLMKLTLTSSWNCSTSIICSRHADVIIWLQNGNGFGICLWIIRSMWREGTGDSVEFSAKSAKQIFEVFSVYIVL